MAIASSLIALVAGKLIDLACTEIGYAWNVGENLRSLLTNCRIVQLKLNRIGDNELRKEWIAWEREVTELFYDVDDIIDDITLDIMKKNDINQQHQQGCGLDLGCSSKILRGVVSRSFSGKKAQQNNSQHHPELQGENQVRRIIISRLDKWNLPHKVNKLLERLELRIKQVDGLLQGVGSDDRPNNLIQWYSTGPLARKRMEDMIFIINRYLLNPNFTGRGVCIVGMSGIGKSTLARYIQYDTAVIEKFTSISWASVGSDLSSPANLVFQNQGHVADGYPVKKYRLLVLDDLWSVQPMAWDKFQSNFGSETIFLITTRDPKVAIVTDTTAYFIERLSDEDCNELIMTDLPQTLSDHQYCRSIFHIARKCAGLPLMAYWLNLLIKFKYREEGADAAISYLEESDLWELKEFRDEIFPALRFDRPPMPPEMGKFIAYLCLFPEGHYFKKDELTLLWMAEGFVRPEKWTALNLNDAGKHFDDILSRYMFYFSLCSSASSEDKTATYEIHEFTRRFAQDIASNMCYQMDSNDKAYYLPAHKIRHLSLGCQALVLHQTLIETYYSKLRTILLLSGKGNNITGVPESFFQKLHLLRVVSLSHSHITTLPRSIGNLKHLRYLDASSTPIQSLPDATCKLFALRVLNLKNCPNLLRLPSDIGNLVNLFHLEVDMARLSSLPRCIGLLTNLQTLEVFTVYNTQGYRITELKNMNNLRGSIKIKNLENVDKASEAKNAKLCLKSYLKRLELHWSRQSSMPEPLVTNILGMLQPHNNLAELQLTNYSGDAFPSWISSPSCRLQVIHLYNCLHITELPPFWKLQDLKSLSINTACSLAQLDREFFGDLEQRRFPQLVSLELQNMKKLARWGKLEPGDMPSLLKLKISGCPVLSNLPNFRFFTSLKVEIIRCPSLKVPKFPPSVLVRIIS